MKLLHVFQSFAPSPASARLGEVVRGARGCRHQIVSLDGDISASADLPARVSVGPFKAGRGRPDQLGLRRLIVDSGAEVLCTYGAGALDAGLANLAGPGLAHIHHHDESDPVKPGGAARLRSIAAAGAFIVFTSPSLANHAGATWRIPRDRLRLIPPGVDTRRFRPFPGHAVPGAMVTFGFIGPLADERAVVALVRAFTRTRSKTSMQFAVYGEGPARPAAESLARAKGARGRVFFRGAASPAVLDEFDVFFYGDNCPMADRIAEAMACGLPIVGAAAGDAPHMVAGENLPILTAPRDVEAYALVLARLVNDSASREAIGAANAAKAREAYALARMTADYASLYREAAGRRRTAG